MNAVSDLFGDLISSFVSVVLVGVAALWGLAGGIVYLALRLA
jgi:hypothetical protein